MSDNVTFFPKKPDGTIHPTVQAVVPDAVPQPSTIKILEKLLEMARTGRLQTFLGVGFTDNGERVSVVNTMHKNVHEMMGSLAFLQFEYDQKVREER